MRIDAIVQKCFAYFDRSVHDFGYSELDGSEFRIPIPKKFLPKFTIDNLPG